MGKALAVVFGLLLCASFAAAQSAPVSLPGYNISLGAGYSSTTGNSTNNGFWSSLSVPVYTFGGTFGKNWDATISARADYFTVTTPSTYVVTAGPEMRFQFSKPTLLNGIVFQPFGNLGLGAARSQCAAAMDCAAGVDATSHFAFKLGGGIDIPMSSSTALRLFEFDYIHSTIFPNGHVVLSNSAQISAGLKWTF